jgi:hypothetical protein
MMMPATIAVARTRPMERVRVRSSIFTFFYRLKKKTEN